MKVLIVIGCNELEDAPFVLLQKNNLEKLGVKCFVFLINKKGIFGYLSLLPSFWKTIKIENPDVIHAHYGLSGLFSIIQLKKPVLISYIGSDLIVKKIRLASLFTMLFTKFSILTSKSLYEIVPFKKKNFRLIPYGIDLENFIIIDKQSARVKLGLNPNKTYCLFPALKSRPEKNFVLAEKSINQIGGIEIIEIGHKKPIQELNLIFNACDFLILTSLYEGGPQVIFEALATNLPIVSTDVGVVKENVKDIDGCYICDFSVEDTVSKIREVLQFKGRTEGRKRIQEINLDSRIIAQDIFSLYEKAIKKNKHLC